MFSTRYFNPRYWASRYWPKVGGEPVVTPNSCDVIFSRIGVTYKAIKSVIINENAIESQIEDSTYIKSKLSTQPTAIKSTIIDSKGIISEIEQCQ